MNRPGLHTLPPRRQTLTDFKHLRQSKRSTFFKTRILPVSRMSVPTISSKHLKNKMIELYPELEETLKKQDKKDNKNSR